ncbi:MAG: hypothetical protein FJZ56_02370 [Chlamydiae bacterium]|nr:hypothetical protein [Chlamydiota bacterium]
MDWILSLNWNWFFLRLIGLLVLSPVIGYLSIRLIESFEKAWKSKVKKKRWIACSFAIFLIAIAAGWFR